MSRLATTDAGAQRDLWAQAFPSLASPDAADHAFLAWLAHGKVLVREYAVKQAAWPATERPLGDADALAARGVALYTFARGQVLPNDIAAALALDPNNLVARMIDSRVHDRIPLEAARAVTTAHPDDWRAWFLLMRAAEGGAEARSAHGRMCEVVAKDAVAMPAGFCP
jgi:hypothetical protein